MKKLSLLLFATFVTLIGWAQNDTRAPRTLNPYAYDLASTWNANTQTLSISFKLNAVPNLNKSNMDGTITNLSTGIQVNAVDEQGNRYWICGPSTEEIKKAHEKTGGHGGSYSYDIQFIDGKSNKTNVAVPTNQILKWEVKVNGVPSSAGQVYNGFSGSAYYNHSLPIYWTLDNNKVFIKKYVAHSVDVDVNPQSPNFGRIFVADGVKTEAEHNSTWSTISHTGFDSYKYGGGRGIYIFEPDFITLKQRTAITLTGATTPNKGGFEDPLEPHDVRISQDGRIFVSSFSGSSNVAVWELSNGYQDWNEVVTKEQIGNKRVISMDLKGSGNDLTLLLLCTPRTGSKLSCVEYNLGTGNKTDISLPNDVTNFNYYLETINEHTKIAYDTNGDIWVSLGNSTGAHMVRIKDNFWRTYGNEWGGEGFEIKGDLVIKSVRNKSGTTQINFYKLSDNTPFYGANGHIVNASDALYLGAWVADFAIDFANNVYIATSYNGRVLPISLPYNGVRTTPAPTGQTFTLADPIPNILATDLRFAPVPKQPEYRFSFNVNTKPAVAQIRFYKSYGDGGENDMKKNLAKINADDYQGGDAIKPSFVYNIPASQLKQGEISVSLGMCGGKLSGEIGSKDCKITNDSLPRGEWYWSVYVEAPRKSTAFAPIYEQGTTGEDTHKRLHVGINNYPETDGFGHVYAVNYFNELDPQNSLMVYGFNPNGKSNDEQNNIKNAYRYKLIKNYLNPTGEKPKFTNQRRLAVAPDGKVYIADCGSSLPFDKSAERPWLFERGGVFVWNPQTQTGDEIQLSLFSTKDLSSTSTAVDIYNHNGQLKLYATNTYGEFENHLDKGYKWNDYEYNEANQENKSIYGWNGFKEFNLGTLDNILLEETNGTKLYSLGMGDGNGNIGIVATDKGVWMAQHRLNDVQYTIDQFKKGVKNPALPDNTENYILSFVPYGSNTRTWTSCTTRGINYEGSKYDQTGASALTQLPSSPLQACPGAGLAYRKTNGKEYLYIVNHQGNIVELQITSWDGTKPFVEYKKTYPTIGPKASFQNTGRLQGVINSMCFDYAGNLITTSGLEYLGSTSEQNIIVYTMPYDRKNAREIQAPNSCRFIPERTAYLEPRSEMNLTLKQYIEGEGTPKPCYLDIFRPMPNTSFSTICLPFDLDMKQLTTEALKDAEVKQYTDLQLSDIGGEQMLELVFKDVPTEGGKQILKANTPYIIQPKVRIPGIIQLQEPIQFVTIAEKDVEQKTEDEEYAISFKGVIPTQQINVQYQNGQPLTLLLVAENRLAEMIPDAGSTNQGEIHGFRGYFELNRPLNGIGARIAPKQSVSTSTTIIVDGKRVNISKYLREGRVYIRVGDTLYTIDGQKVQ